MSATFESYPSHSKRKQTSYREASLYFDATCGEWIWEPKEQCLRKQFPGDGREDMFDCVVDAVRHGFTIQDGDIIYHPISGENYGEVT